MPRKFLFQLSLAVFAALLTATTVSAQTESCAVKIEVTQNDSSVKIVGTTATAVNSRTKRIYTATLRGGMPYFARLPEGEYRITVAKARFMRSADDFVVSCTDNVETFAIELFRGSSAKTMKLYEGVKLKAPPLRRAEANVYTERGGGASGVGSSTNETGRGNEEIPPPTQGRVPRTISAGVINGKAINLVKPPYPAAARAVQASGAVNVQVTVDENGNVISASAVSGHPLLRSSAVQAARASKFSPLRLSGQPVKYTGVIVYNFVP